MITFTRTRQTYNETTAQTTPVETLITGSAIQVRPSIQRYQALGLSVATMPTLLFTPTLYGIAPEPGDAVVWAGKPFTVKDVEPIAPDGVLIMARVAIGA